MRRTALISSLVFLFYLFCSWNSFAVLVVDQTEGHPGVTITVSNNHGAGVKTVGIIMFGTTQITATDHNLTATKGQINSDQVVTDLNGDYKITFSVPDLPANSYLVQIGDLSPFTFDLTQPVLNRNTGYVGNSLRIFGFHGIAEFTIGAIQLDNGSRTITKTDNALKAIVGAISDDNKVVTDASGSYEVIFEIPNHVGGPIVFTLGGTKMPFTLLASITSIEPKEVKYGETITIRGQGFSQLDTLTVNIGELTYKFPASGNPVNANGYFSISAQIGNIQWQPTHDVAVSGNVSGNKVSEIEEVVINPSITFHDPQGDLGNSSGTANAIVYVTGRNFAGSGRDDDEKVSIKFDNKEVTKVGQFDFSLQPPGKFSISFVTAKLNNGGNLEIQAQGTISSPYPVIDFLYSLPDSRPKLETSKNIGQPGLQIDITGTGYSGDADIGTPVLKLKTANTYSALAIDEYVVGSDPSSSSAKIKTDTDGKFHIKVTVPNKSANLYQVWINKEDANNNSQLDDGEDANSNSQLDYFNTNNDTTKEFRIIPKLTVVAGQLKRVGQSFSVSGAGFGASEPVDIKLTADDVSPVPLTQIQADVDGNISSTDLKINPQTYGNKKIIASGITSQLTAVADETVKILNQITSASPDLGTNISVGQSITLEGNGWGTNEKLIVTVSEFNSANVSEELDRLTTDANGVFSHSLVMLSLGGTGVFKLTISGSAATSSEPQTVLSRGTSLLSWSLQGSTDYPIILIQQNSGQVGDTITAKATTNPVAGDLLFGNTVVTVDSSTTDGNGNFDITFKVPEKPTGTHLIKYNKSEVPYAVGSKITNILPNSDVTINQVVTVEGKGYPAKSRIEVKFDSIVVATVISNSSGTFSAGFPLPVVAGSTSHQITAVATISGETATAVTFPTNGNKVTGKVTSIQPVIGTAKTPVALSGNGFKSYQTVTIQFDGTDVLNESGAAAATFLTSELGTLTATFYLPEKPSGTKQITVNGQANVGFTIRSSVSLSPKSTPVGDSITVTGNGFAASEAITFKVEDKTVDTASVGTDGKFSKAITVPRLGGGSRTIEVIGGSGSYSTASFSVLGKITSVEPNGGTVQCGDEAIVTGEGFMPNEDLYVDFGTTQAIAISSGDTAVRDDGTFITKFRISTQPTGVKDLTVRQASGSSDSRENAVQIVGQLTRLLIDGKPRSESNKTIECSAELTLAGRGFTAGSDLEVVLKTTSDIDVTYETHGLLNPVIRSDGTFVIIFNTNNLGADQGIDIQVTDVDEKITVSTRTQTDTDEEPDVYGGIDVVGRILTFAPLTGTADTEIEITGCGYHAGATVEVRTPSIVPMLGNATVEAVSAVAAGTTATAGTEDEVSGAGTYKVAFKFGDLGESVDLPLGPVKFTVSSTGGGFTIEDTTAPFILSEADSKRVDVTPLFGSSEDQVTIIGTGFPANQEVGHVTFDGERISVTSTGVGLINPVSNKIMADTSGVFQVLATVPAVTHGVKLVATTDVPATTRGSFEVRKKLSIIAPSTASGYIGTEITVKGTGFNAAEIRSLRFNGVHVTSANYGLKIDEGIGNFVSNDRIQTDSLGRFKVKFVVPPIASGRPIMVTTDDGGVANFEVVPRISLVSPAALKNGTAIRVVGDGFRSNESIVVDFGNPVQRSQFNANFLGQFDSYTQPVQLQTSSVKPLAIKGLDSSIEVNSFFYVEPSLEVEGVIAQNGTFVLGISSGKVGTFMRLRGKGFDKNDLVTLKIGAVSINIDQRIISNKDGEFTADIKIPRIVGGTKKITATGTNGDVASTTFTITAQLLSINGVSITPVGFTLVDVQVDDVVSIVGDGFLSTQTISFEVGISGQGSLRNTGMRSAETDGFLATTFTVPAMSYGPKVVRLTTSAPSSQINIVGIRVVGRIKPDGISNRRSGFPEPVGSDGSSIYLWGDGFEENKPITVTLTPLSGGNSVQVTNENLLDMYGSTGPKTNSSGRFDQVEFKIPDPSGFASGLVTVTVATPNTSTEAELIFSQVDSGGQLQISGSKRVTPDQRIQIRGFGYDNGADDSGIVVGQLELQTTTSSHTRVVAGLSDEGAGSYNVDG
ncbi:TPA: hypothetical protein EYN09_08050, partial [Candidatus Poribacteria bacterium]|nr:hypothetical protein [Candidatus Poribacteria bacterium]